MNPLRLVALATILSPAGFGLSDPQSTSAPSTQASPSTQKTTYRRPIQADVLRELIREREDRKPIQPISVTRSGDAATSRPTRSGLFPEGTVLIEKSGKLVYDGQIPVFEFDSLGIDGEMLRLEILRTGLLEQMEQAAKSDTSTFIVTAETTTYQSRNYLLLKKVSSRLTSGNVGP